MMGRLLNKKLRYFPIGQDGGIDLVDDLTSKNVLIQVKHYEKSSFSTFKSALKKEQEKVERLQPKQYYIFTSQSLSPDQINKVYSLFSNYMDTERNIITRQDINTFLKSEENVDILRSHFKLWITADIVLKDFLNHDVFIDSEVLLHDIDEEIKSFVQTDIFNKCIATLEKERKVLLYGDPGVGKTLNSKMLLLNFVKKGYHVRYSSSTDITELKKSVTANKEAKEVIFLDDCLGQHYFNFKEGHDEELLSLIKHVDLYKQKVLILNSRVTILNEARNKFEELERYFGSEKISFRKINMNNVNEVDKARIFYAMLKRNKVSNKYYKSVRKNRNYMNVVRHKNFNPRVIEYVTLPSRINTVLPHDYYKFIINNLNNPNDIWKNEFQHRLEYIDRLFMYILYSLTDIQVPINALEKSFNYFISHDKKTDNTLHSFESVLQRLNQSLIKIIDINGVQYISVLNPSINDYMNITMYKNKLLLKELNKNAIYLEQIERLNTLKDFKERLKQLVIEEDIQTFNTINKGYIYDIIIHTIGESKILKEEYLHELDLLDNLNSHIRIGEYYQTKARTIKQFIRDPELFNFYQIKNILDVPERLEQIYDGIDFEEAVKLTCLVEDYYNGYPVYPDPFSDIIFEEITSKLESYLDDYDYSYAVETWCLDNPQNNGSIDYMTIIDDVKRDIELLTSNIDGSITSILEKEFDDYESAIIDYIDDAFKDILDYNSNSHEKIVSEENINIDDILNRPIMK